MPVERLEALETWVHAGLQPDLTLFFDVPVPVGQQRLQAGQHGLDRFEREAAQFHERVRAAYLERAARYPARIRVIDASRPISDIRKALEQVTKNI